MEDVILQTNNKKTAPPELLMKIKAEMPKPLDKPNTISAILRRAKGGCTYHRFRGKSN